MPKPKKSARSPRALRITRVYTKTGDDGTTGLVGGQRVKKDSPRIEAYGTVDELAVAIGAARHEAGDSADGLASYAAHLSECDGHGHQHDLPPGVKAGDFAKAADDFALLGEHLRYLQNLLFTLGGDLATRVEDRWENMPLIAAEDSKHLERLIDAYNAALPPLKDFILPSGGPLALALHQARVAARRAERRVQTLAGAERIGPHALVFLNRLSDLFFVLARWAAGRVAGLGLMEPEAIWDRAMKPPAIPKFKAPK